MVDKLTRAEKYAWNLINDNLDFFVKNNLKTLAINYAVGEATLIRLVKKLGYKSLKQMQMDCIPKTDINSLIEVENSYDSSAFTTIQNISRYELYSILETKKLLNEQDLIKVADLIIQARSINIFGIENSYLSGLLLKTSLEKIGINPIMSQSIHGVITQLQFLDDQDLIIIYSNSGETKECLHLAKFAFDKKIALVWIGSPNKKTLLNQATIKIYHSIHHHESLRFPNVSSSTSQVFISNLIFNLVLQRKKDVFKKLKIGDELTKKWNL